MSTAAAGARREAWPWIGHNGWKFLIGICVINAVPLGWYSPVSTWTNFLLTMTMFSLFVAMYQHDRALCDRCIAQWPLDPQKQIEKHDRALRGVHFFERLLPSFTPAGLKWGKWAVAAAVSAGYVGFVLLLDWVTPDWVSEAFRSFVHLVLLPVFWWVIYQHRRLQGWCPYCRHGGRGKHTFNPDPVPSRTKDLV